MDPRLVVGVTTEVVAGEGHILTADGIDCHIHFICPQQITEALASGVITMVGRWHYGHHLHAGRVRHPDSH